ncbi:MAG: Dam family site-specific DNA-(adenine-N6)-methyltransferase [Chloroflexi bacterium]|nr:Dam family site-specific DNA-(adenine-N6)-methyltransferase [Chloroflexota bacterium]
MITEKETLIPVSEASEILGVPPGKIRDLLRSGDLQGIKDKGRWLINLEQLSSLDENDLPGEENGKVVPFIKWAGGKTQMLRKYHGLFPSNFRQYVEPFCGGAAVFFHLYSNGFIRGNAQVLLLDLNEELVNTFIVVRDYVEDLIRELKDERYENTRETFEKIRSQQPRAPVLRAARTIYLNRTCFNGLYRVNGKGEFNVPFGKHKNPVICNEASLKAASVALSRAVIKAGDFEIAKKHAGIKDFVYMDPPYFPVSETAGFTRYTAGTFTEEDHARLAVMYRELDRRGCFLMLSNSDTGRIRELYSGYKIVEMEGRRNINSRADGRGAVSELVILNYEPGGIN